MINSFVNDEEYIWEKYKTIILNEAIPLSIAKKSLTKKDLPKNYTLEMNQIFNNRDRIILPFNSSEYLYMDSDTEKEVTDFLQKHGIYILSKDYKRGYYSKRVGNSTKQQDFRIGKKLQELGALELLDKYKKDESRQLKNKDLVIVISRHPYDIAGASTDRNWKSCITRNYKPIVYKGKKESSYKRGEEEDPTKPIYIKDPNYNPEHHKCNLDGGIIFYLVPKKELIGVGDKIQLRKPISRIFFELSSDGKVWPSTTGERSKIVYGVDSKDFTKQSEEWIASNFDYTPHYYLNYED